MISDSIKYDRWSVAAVARAQLVSVILLTSIRLARCYVSLNNLFTVVTYLIRPSTSEEGIGQLRKLIIIFRPLSSLALNYKFAFQQS